MSKAPLLIASAVLSAGAAAIKYKKQREAEKANEKAQKRWLEYQERARARAMEDETTDRRQAWERANELMEANTEESRMAAIDAGAEELENQYADTSGVNDIMNEDIRASGQEKGRSGNFDVALASELSKATGDVRKRLQALARAGGYGYAGMGGMIDNAQRGAVEDISEINARREGTLDVLAAHRAVQPEMFVPGSSPLADIMQVGGAITGAMAGAGYGGGGTNFFGAATGGGSPGSTFGNTQALSGMTGQELIPGGSPNKGFSFLNVPWNNNVVQY